MKHFINSIQKLYKIHKETDWKAVQKMISLKVRYRTESGTKCDLHS